MKPQNLFNVCVKMNTKMKNTKVKGLLIVSNLGQTTLPNIAVQFAPEFIINMNTEDFDFDFFDEVLGG